MTRGDEHQHHGEWEAQLERLSAYADGELDAPDRAAVEAHLPTCERCRAALAELRAVRGLLRAMPAPALPRSFALPEDVPALVQLATAPRPIRTAGRRPYAPSPAARAAQWLGGLAAAVGLTLLLGSAIAQIAPHGYSSTAGGALPATRYGGASTGHQAPAQTPAQTPALTRPSAEGTPAQTPQHGETPSTGVQSTPTQAPSGTQHGTAATPESQPQVPIVPLTGAIRVVAGGATVVGGRVAARRRPPSD
jgi:hypothetical protein